MALILSMLPCPSSVQIALDVPLRSFWSCAEEVLVGVSLWKIREAGKARLRGEPNTHRSSFPLMLRGKSSCDVPASAIGRLKVTGPERAVNPRADLQFLVGEWPSQQRSLYRTCHWFRFSPCGARRLQTMTLVASTNAAIEKFTAKAESAASEKEAKDFSKYEAELFNAVNTLQRAISIFRNEMAENPAFLQKWSDTCNLKGRCDS